EYSINDIPLTEDEISSIKYAVDTLHQFKEAPFFKDFGNAIDKIVDRISVAGDENQMSKYIQFESATSLGGNEFLPLLLEAIQRKKKLWFVYTSFIKDAGKPRKVSPLFLKEYRNRWYLISYDPSQKDIRTYALDRMEDLKILEDEQDVLEGFDPESYFQNAMGITSHKGNAYQILLKAGEIASKYIKSQPIHHSQSVVKEEEEATYFEFKLLLSEELIRTLLSYGGELQVIEPQELKSLLIERILSMRKVYDL
ncbi:MAG: WYL domain-containing protein, partial [Crocinitomicaceae bacterium]